MRGRIGRAPGTCGELRITMDDVRKRSGIVNHSLQHVLLILALNLDNVGKLITTAPSMSVAWPLVASLMRVDGVFAAYAQMRFRPVPDPLARCVWLMSTLCVMLLLRDGSWYRCEVGGVLWLEVDAVDATMVRRYLGTHAGSSPEIHDLRTTSIE